MRKIDYVGQQYGTRLVVKNQCEPNDWIKLGAKPPKHILSYVLGKCLICGNTMPSQLKLIRRQPPMRCALCSNIGNRLKFSTMTNTWNVKQDVAFCNVLFKNRIVSFVVDADFYGEASKFQWRISQKRNKYYVVTGSAKKGTMIYLHSMVLGKPDNNMEIDHIDGNSLNNRKSNLRFVTHSENVDNLRATRIDNELGIRGISFDNKDKKFVVDFTYHNKRFYLKSWKTIEEAIYCRRILENRFDLHMLENNPVANYYDEPTEETKKSIEEYVHNQILRNERY